MKALDAVRTVIREAEKRAQESEDGYLVDVDRIVRDIEELKSAYEKVSDGNE